MVQLQVRIFFLEEQGLLRLEMDLLRGETPDEIEEAVGRSLQAALQEAISEEARKWGACLIGLKGIKPV